MSQAGDETTLCGICGSNPNEKRILGCQHLLCKDCADMLADAVKPGVGLSCPFCGQAAERIVDLTIAKPEAAETAHTVAPVPPPPQPHEPPPPPPPVASRVSLDEVVSALSSEQAQALLIELARSMPQVDEVVRARAAAMVVPTPANGREALPSPSAGVSSRGEAGPGSVYQKLSNWRHNRTSTGMIFGCNKATMAECLKRMLFGLPDTRSYKRAGESVVPHDSALFLFNYSDRQLYGVFTATSPVGHNIEPTAWKGSGHWKHHRGGRGQEGSPFPTQVRVQLVHRFPPLPEDIFGPVLNYRSQHQFDVGLSPVQVSQLMELYMQADPASNVGSHS